MGKTGKYVLIGVGGLFVWWFVDRNIMSLGFPQIGSSAGALFGPIANANRACACAMGLGVHEAGRVVHYPPKGTLRALFGREGAGQVLQAVTVARTQYDPPPQNPPIGSAYNADISRDPATRQGSPASPTPQTPRETEGDRGKLTTPVLVGGFVILLVALYFLAK